MVDLQSDAPAPSPAESLAAAKPDASDALAHLARMSGTGSAFGQADYVAINTTAVVSLLLGVASALSIVASMFLFIPVLGVLLGLIAVKQIRNSSGTQSGIGLALGGILASLGLGGFVIAGQALQWSKIRSDSRQASAVIVSLSDELKAIDSLPRTEKAEIDRRLSALYDSEMTQAFRVRVDRSTFVSQMRNLAGDRLVGGKGVFVSLLWNDEPMEFTPLPGTDAVSAIAMTRLTVTNRAEPLRLVFRLTNKEGPWKIDSLLELFPEVKPKDLGPQ